MVVDGYGWKMRSFSSRPSTCHPFPPLGLNIQGSGEKMIHRQSGSGDISFIKAPATMCGF